MYGEDLTEIGQQILKPFMQWITVTMARWMTSYRLAHGRWPSTIRAAFPGNIRGSATFPEGASAHADFVRMCAQLGLSLTKPQRYLDVKDREVADYGFHYLSIVYDNTIQGDRFLDDSTRCSGVVSTGGQRPRRCSTGVIQSNPIELGDYKPATDIVGVYNAATVRMYVVSRNLMRAILAVSASGVEFVPLADSDEFWQLKITTQTIAPPRVGRVDVTRRCPVCGVLHWFQTEHPSRFKAANLAVVDFQYFDMLRSDTEVYRIAGFEDIVSARIQALLVNGGFTGRRAYYGDPPIEFGIVEIA